MIGYFSSNFRLFFGISPKVICKSTKEIVNQNFKFYNVAFSIPPELNLRHKIISQLSMHQNAKTHRIKVSLHLVIVIKVTNILLLTLTLASVRFVHMAISSRVDMSGYRFLANVASNSCNCWLVKCVLCRRCRLFFLSPLSSIDGSSGPTPGVVDSVFIVGSDVNGRLPDKF